MVHSQLMLDKGSLNQTALDAALQNIINIGTLGGDPLQKTFLSAPKPDGGQSPQLNVKTLFHPLTGNLSQGHQLLMC